MTAHRHTANRETGQRGGRKTQEALARLHSARVAKSRHRAALPGAGGRHLPLQGGAPSWIRNEFGRIQAVFVSPELAAWIVESADALARLRADQFDECLGRNIAMGVEFGAPLTEDCEIEI